LGRATFRIKQKRYFNRFIRLAALYSGEEKANVLGSKMLAPEAERNSCLKLVQLAIIPSKERLVRHYLQGSRYGTLRNVFRYR
jgi:hypothetical protein